MERTKVLIVKGSPREDGNSVTEIVGLVYGYASDAYEIKNNGALMQRAYELGRDLGT